MIALYNLEPKYTNIALEKINLFYKQQGELVVDYYPICKDQYDKVYCSSIFIWSDKSYVTDDIICGGSGFDLITNLPSEIEAMKPKINMGFTTRGCIRNCSFCIVPEKEGKIKATGNIYDFWDGIRNEIVILDNNILALPKHFELICNQIIKENIKVDFNQGLDIRLINNDNVKILSKLKYAGHGRIRFAWDFMKDEKCVIEGINLLLKYFHPDRIFVYVLIGYNTTENEDLYRVNLLKQYDVNPFVMPYNKASRLKRFTRWVNHKAIFKSVAWEDYK